MSYAGINLKLVDAERLARSRLPDSESGGSAVPRKPRAGKETKKAVQPRMDTDSHGYEDTNYMNDHEFLKLRFVVIGEIRVSFPIRVNPCPSVVNKS